MAEATATIRIVGKDDASREIGKVHGALEGLSVKGVAAGVVLGELGASAIKRVGQAMVDFGKESVKAAAALELVQRRGEAIFGGSFPQLNREMEGLSKQLGRNQSDLQQYANDLGALFKGSGLASEQIADLGKSVAQLSVDLASFTGATDVEAFEALRSGLLGMERPLRALGIVISDTDIKNEALRLGIRKEVTDMSDAQLMILRYGVALEKTKDIQGDAEKNQNSYDNSVKKLQASFNDLQETLGQPALPRLAAIFSDLAGILNRGVIPAIKIAAENFEFFGGVIAKYMPGLVQALGAVRDLVTYMAQTPDIKSITPEIGREDVDKAVEAAKKNGTTVRDEISKILSAAKQARPDIKAMWDAAAGGGAGGGSEAENELKKVESALNDLKGEYWSARSEVDRALGQLVNDHKDKMAQIKEQIQGTKDQLADLERMYKRATGGTDTSEADVINDEIQKIEELTKKLRDLNLEKESQQNQGLGVEVKLTNKIEDATKELEKEKSALAAMQKAASSDVKKLSTERADKSDLENRFNDLEVRRKQDKEDHDLRFQQLQAELLKNDEKAKAEQKAYQDHRRELQETKTALIDFHDTYIQRLGNLEKVTQDTVDSLKKKLEDLKTTISNIDALMKAKPDITGGTTVTDKAKGRAAGGVVTESMTLVGERGPELVSLPYGSQVYSNKDSKRMSGTVSVHIGEVHVHDEADENRLIEKLARLIQLQQLASA